jgi:hypothetical protein
MLDHMILTVSDVERSLPWLSDYGRGRPPHVPFSFA